MSSRRRTFHVDWDSPSDETGTVKRRPASFSVSSQPTCHGLSIFNADVRNCIENVQYYEVKDCTGGFGLKFLNSFDVTDSLSAADSDSLTKPEKVKEVARASFINGIKSIRGSGRVANSKNTVTRDKEELAIQNSAVKDNRTVGGLVRSSRTGLQSHPSGCKGDQGETLSGAKKTGTGFSEEKMGVESSPVSVAADVDLGKKSFGDQKSSPVPSRTSMSSVTPKLGSCRKDFGLKLTQKPFNFSSKLKNVNKNRSPTTDAVAPKKTGIPRLKMKGKSSTQNFSFIGRGLVNSSSESSGIGSPLSPLSPNQDTVKLPTTSGRTGSAIKNSDSTSSGLGSPDSPLSPDSQQYSAAYLIHSQLEKLHNCSCERRQAEIYTDWANHYLERGGSRRRVTDLQADLCDGVLLADLVEAVTNQKVIDVNRKPRNTQQMVENVSLCVGALRALGADVGAVNPGELASGSTLRPVLALLFALSRHKQRAKQLQDMPRLPSPYNKQAGAGGPGGQGGTSIPLPATVAATRRCPPDKVRPAPSPAHQTQLGGLKHGNGGIGSASSSRSTSPSQQQPPQGGLSFIPQPRSQNPANRHPPATTPSPRASTVGRPGGLRAPQASPYAAPQPAAPQQGKNSVLDKFKLFNNKEKNQERSKASSGVSKRTSSSSGFSSARSEHSDSSTSLCDQSKVQVESPKTRALKSKLQAKPAKQASPKTARKEQAKAQSKIARTKGPEKGLAYTPPIDDAKSSKISNIAPKVTLDKKPTNIDFLKPGNQVHKSNSAFTVPKTITSQEPKIVANLKSESKPTQRPKMELPGKISDPKLQLQGLKGPPNGLNKDFVVQKGLTPNSNGFIKQNTNENNYTGSPMSPNHGQISPFEKTISINQSNAPDGQNQQSAENQQQQPIPSKEGESEKQYFVNNSPSSQNGNQKSPHSETRTEPRTPNQNETLTKTSLSPISHNVTNGSSHANNYNSGQGGDNNSCQNKIKSELISPPQGTPQQNSESVGNNLGHSLANSTQNLAPGSSIPKPTALVKGTSKPPKDPCTLGTPTPTKYKPDSLHRKLDPNTVAMVSPMPSISDLMSESSHSNSNSTGQSNSSDSSVIYRPSSESGSDIKTIPNRKIETTFEQMEKVLSEVPNCGGGPVTEEDTEMTVKPMQPLLRGYTPGARGLQTLPSRTTTRQYTVLHSSSHHHVGHVGHDYADSDIASGYMSDREVLRGGIGISGGPGVGSRTLSDLCDGYISEGGAPLYARRIIPDYTHDDRLVNGSRRELSGVKELVSSRRVQKRPSGTGRSDGGGLLGGCSGGNDALAELTIEELASIPATNHSSSNHTGHPSHHKRVPGGGSVVVGGGVVGGTATPQGPGVQQQGHPSGNNVVHRVVSSRHPGGSHHHVKKSDSSQQTESSAFKQPQQNSNSSNSNSNSQQWKMYIEAGAARDRDTTGHTGPPSPSPSRRSQDKHRKQAMAEYANGEKPQKVSSGTSTSSGSGSSKVRGVPQSFGYVKRHSAGTNNANGTQNGSKDPTRTAQVSAVPRTKVKVSGGTQTCTTELQANSGQNQGQGQSQGHHYKSYSLTGASASQLSQSVRDRLMLGSQSLPKPGSPEFTALFAAAHHRGGATSSFTPRVLKPSDGSLSDTCSNYAAPDVQGYYAGSSPYATTSWMRHSNTYTPSGRSQGMGLCEADSVESLGSHRASLTHARLLMHQRDSTGSPAPPRLNRSNSIRSTKSEKMYPSMLARGSGASSSVGEEVGVGVGVGVGVEPYYSVPVGSAGCPGQHWSQPTSPTPTHAPRQPPNLYQHVHKDDDIHGSSVSLVSTASSLYSSAEEKQAHELRKLRRELLDAQEKVHSLTSQLSTNAHVVSAFEQSLSNMTQRLQHLTATAEKKDSELQELRDTIERLRKQSAEAGLNATNQNASTNGRRHTLGDSESTTGCTGSNSNHQGSSIARQLSADSVTSLNSLSSACSASSHHKKKGWLRSSFSKAFSRSRKNRHGSVSDAEDCKDGPGELSAPNSPRLPTAAKHESRNQAQGARSNGQRSPENENGLSGSKSSSALYKKEDEDVDELKKQLREKDMVLTDIRLEALSSAHQLESLKDTVIKMRNEMLNLKQNNERLQRLVTSKSLTSSQSSLPSDPERRFSMTEVASSVAAMSSGGNPSGADQLEDLTVPEHPVVQPAASTTNEPPIEQDTDGKRINVAIYLGSERSFNSNVIGNTSTEGNNEPPHCVIASVCISNKTSWDSLDATVRRCFKEYVARVDPVTNLGLGVECVAAYHLGESSRCTSDSQLPELLPCGYLVGHVRTIYLVLSGYSWLAVDTLIPRSIVQRLVSLLTEHRRVILCGPSGTGKSYLAGKLAHALVDADTETKDAASVATFNVDHKSSKELRQYLAHIAERCDSSAADELPRVIILENLQHAASLGELFSGLLGTRHSSCPAIIGTMSQATCSTTNLQLHHNFRWVLCANHMEPVKGFLGRYLRRRLLEHELRESGGARNAEMAAVVEWIPRVWLHLNKFLETHSSSDVTIGPRLFLSCPMEVAGSQVWFTDVWNYSVVPYLVDAVREGLTLYGRRISGNGNGDSPWEDPAHFITSTYPWVATHAVHGGSDALRRMRPEDVGYDVVTSGHNSGVGTSSVKSLGSTHSDTEGDPLLNMLMRLQEAANYSSPHSNDSDSVTSLDSSHTRHSEDLTCSSSTSSSRGVESTL